MASSSSDEGEIADDGATHLKATSMPHVSRSGIDRKDRLPSRYGSSDDDSTSKHNSHRSSRGYKRGHDDYDSRDRHRHHDSRYSRDDHDRDGYKRSRVSYDDLDEPSSSSNRDRSRDRYHDRYGSAYRNRRPRSRSRSPRRRYDSGPNEDRAPRDSHRDRRNDRLAYDDDSRSRRSLGQRQGDHTIQLSRPVRDNEPATQVPKPGILKKVEPEPEPEQDQNFDDQEAFDEDAEIERRRKRREALLAKSSSATPLLLHAVGAAADKAGAESPASSTLPGTPQMEQYAGGTPGTPQSPNSPARLDLASDFNIMNVHGSANFEEDGPSAADYDPTLDMQEDERRDGLRHAQPEAKPSQPAPAKADEDDENFDMFADDFDEDKYATNAAATADAIDGGPEGGILEGDDREGYYKMRIGEVLNNRYQIQTTLGKGMFSGVVGAIDITTRTPVAIKIIRNNDALRKAGHTEIAILQKLNDADPENRKHIVKFERSFEFRGHLCMAFENLSMNLREVLRKFGNNVGINLSATRTYAYQIFVALAHMQKCSIIHADLKPDNILVNETRNVLKICDLGTAIDRSDAATAHNNITPYLVSRYYRAPEIILGMPYEYGVDMWSIGCTLYEMYTGKILFTGDSNNQMLKAIMEIRGRFTPKLYKRGQLAINHFDDLGQFVSVEQDRVLGKTSVRTLPVVKPTRDLRTRLLAASSGMTEAETKDLHNFIDLLEHCLALNPDKRIQPLDALKHPFFTAAVKGSARR
ncbi:Putative Serine threonine-protein kinase prp4 [[Torrubiella] hemipterigena]|uniref:non-specific serine/threonine protein kinase n=1 Tax=[Torrubiella] hemipterigena TaxID=1531966 RepID=A0A0A1SN30_9HYPO|nr:Putative Serine threonine-protein kinase prp4 [[Torrubiella] hemipterigena]